jgi:hypothetical protein
LWCTADESQFVFFSHWYRLVWCFYKVRLFVVCDLRSENIGEKNNHQKYFGGYRVKNY